MRCPGCPRLNQYQATAVSRDDEELLDHIDRLARQRDSGGGVPANISDTEWELLLIRDEVFEAYDRTMRLKMVESLEILVAAFTQRR